MAQHDTVRVSERGLPGEKRIHQADFNPAIHVLLNDGAEAAVWAPAPKPEPLDPMPDSEFPES